jgi:CubicO group peptidase (beta-lactamase class C family)
VTERRYFFSILLLLGLGACGPVTAPAPRADGPAKLEPLLAEFVRNNQVPGLAIAVIREGRVVYAAGFGVTRAGAGGQPVTPRTLFHMASVTKPFVATAIMQLVERGMVDLDAPVTRYLPYFRLADARYREITVRQLLSHTAGMPDVEDYGWDRPETDAGALERYVRSLGGAQLVAGPGTIFRYSNIGFEVLGDVVAKVSGMSFEDYVRSSILAPIGMKDSTLLLGEADRSLLASPHVADEQSAPRPSPVFPYNRAHAPSSTLYSNVLDMTRWALANLNRGELDGRRILSASLHQQMWRPAGPGFTTIGISWFLDEHRGLEAVRHGGGDVGFVSHLVLLPTRGIAVVAMSNLNLLDLGPIVRSALDLALDHEPDTTWVRPSIMMVMNRTLAARGVEAAVEEFRTLRRTRPHHYNFSAEGHLNALGYRFLGEKRGADAIRIFVLNAEVHPTSVNVWDSLAEAYVTTGDTARAIETYRRVLELDPKNGTALGMLEKLRAD